MSAAPEHGHMVELYVEGARIPESPGGTPVWGFLLLRDNIPVDAKGGIAGVESSDVTSNVAEYEAFINALDHVKRLGWDQDKVVVYTDSEQLQKQLKGESQVAARLVQLYEKAKSLISVIPFLEVRKILPEQNRVALQATKEAYYEALSTKLSKARRQIRQNRFRPCAQR